MSKAESLGLCDDLKRAHMSHSMFDFLCDKIHPHPLLVALSHLGLNGNGGPLVKLFKIITFGIWNKGTIKKYTNFCLRALIELEYKYTKWPSSAEREFYFSGNNQSSVFTKLFDEENGVQSQFAYCMLLQLIIYKFSSCLVWNFT
ncbi:uncharacterized protein VP01_1031g5 [Puccinia sorghi]|uniref:Uncharacterized protein n=1 Tax=Puccinia sorghi TaxID=27349 RepID=A0A0L6VUY8_9BASI|nr:uncharacterized protein VP01_1031g5 [Puccinia sorghi]